MTPYTFFVTVFKPVFVFSRFDAPAPDLVPRVQSPPGFRKFPVQASAVVETERFAINS